MARPSGMCEGVPCYTDEDRTEIQSEIAGHQAASAAYQASEAAIHALYVAEEDAIETLNQEFDTASGSSACP